MVADGLRDTTVKDYIDTLNQVRSAAVAPAALSAGLAQQWANAYLTTPFTRKHGEGAKQYFRSPQTLHARVRKLNAIWSQYVVRRMRAAKENPWETVDLPKLDRLPVRTLSANQVVNFFDWLTDRWKGWELPRLFFETKAVCGSRLMDLCSVRSSDLADGKIFFAQGTAKARKARIAVLPPDLFASLKKLAGPVWLWESYASEMPKYLALRGVPTHRVNPVFDPERLNWWAKDEVDDFNKAHPGAPKIQSHDFRKRAITEAHRAGLDLDTAAAGVGMSTTTARTYYLALEQEKAATEVAAKLGHILRPTPPPTSPNDPQIPPPSE